MENKWKELLDMYAAASEAAHTHQWDIFVEARKRVNRLAAELGWDMQEGYREIMNELDGIES